MIDSDLDGIEEKLATKDHPQICELYNHKRLEEEKYKWTKWRTSRGIYSLTYKLEIPYRGFASLVYYEHLYKILYFHDCFRKDYILKDKQKIITKLQEVLSRLLEDTLVSKIKEYSLLRHIIEYVY